MTQDDPVHQREADAGALELRGVVQTLKHAEQLFLVARIEARTVVPDEVDVLLVVGDRADLDDGLLLLGAELQSIREEIGPHLLEQHAIAFRSRQRAESKLRPSRVMLSAQSVV